MHDLTAHNYIVVAALFFITYVLHIVVKVMENIEIPNNVFILSIASVVECFSKVLNVGLGIAVGIEMFMIAHGG